jgi:mRNA-degrading endonuclease RelE of RelBE toxin-antitoxin system
VTPDPAQRYEIRFQPAARRAITQRLPEGVAAAVLKFCGATLAVNPHRVGKSLFGPLAGCHGARRGTYRIIYRIEENGCIVHVLDIDQRFSTDAPVHLQSVIVSRVIQCLHD